MRRRFRSGISASSGLGLSSFSTDELDSIHYATLQILQNTGIKVMNEQALEIYHDGGAAIERHDGYGIVKLPPYLVAIKVLNQQVAGNAQILRRFELVTVGVIASVLFLGALVWTLGLVEEEERGSLGASFELPVLDQVALQILAHPEIDKIRIEGHTDSDGSDAYNMKLSQRRGDAVLEFLVTHDAVHLTCAWSGATSAYVSHARRRPGGGEDLPRGLQRPCQLS